MAWAGSQTISRPKPGYIQVVETGFDADAEESTVIDLHSYIGNEYTSVRLPRGSAITLQVERTAGTTDVVDIAIQGSMDNSNFADIITLTSSNTPTPTSVAYNATPFYVQYRYIKTLCTTVGLGNTLKTTIFIDLT